MGVLSDHAWDTILSFCVGRNEMRGELNHTQGFRGRELSFVEKSLLHEQESAQMSADTSTPSLHIAMCQSMGRPDT